MKIKYRYLSLTAAFIFLILSLSSVGYCDDSKKISKNPDMMKLKILHRYNKNNIEIFSIVYENRSTTKHIYFERIKNGKREILKRKLKPVNDGIEIESLVKVLNYIEFLKIPERVNTSSESMERESETVKFELQYKYKTKKIDRKIVVANLEELVTEEKMKMLLSLNI